MPKNKIQFQPGLSLQSFQQKYGSEDLCRKQLFHRKWPSGYTCPKCGHDRFYLLSCRSLYQCRNCHHQCSLTSGTIFAASKLPLTIWFLAIFLLTQAKEGMSALSLGRFLGVSANGALRMKHKLQQVMKNADDNLQLIGLVELDDVYWGGKRPGGKRGRGAGGKTSFLAGIARNEEGHPIHMRMSRVGSFTSSEINRWSEKHIHKDSLVVTDGFSAFKGLWLAGFEHDSVVMSERYKNPDNKVFLWANTMIGNVKRAINGTYHAISQKHLPRYLAKFCFRFNNRFQLECMVGALINFAAQTKPIPQHQLKLAEDWW